MTYPFDGLDHIGIAVADLSAATQTYRDVLGFTDHGSDTLADRGITVRFLSMGGDDHTRIELLGSDHAQSEIAGFLQKRGEGIHHMCVRVHDLEGTLEKIAAAGGRIVGATSAGDLGIRPGAHNTRVAFVHPKSTHGVLLELVELTNASQQHPT